MCNLGSLFAWQANETGVMLSSTKQNMNISTIQTQMGLYGRLLDTKITLSITQPLEKYMHCPKCQANMEKVATPKGVVDRCIKCKGLWFDLLEHEDLKSYSSVVDTGGAESGAQSNKIDRIKCPVCPNSALIRMVDPAQPHIWFESCPTCYGRYFDAGEFSDLAEHTVSDFIKRLSLKARG